MDLSFTFDKYLDKSKGDAYNLYRDEKNLSILRKFLFVSVIVFAIITLIAVIDKGFMSVKTISFNIIFIAFLITLLTYKKYFNLSNIRKYLFFVLVTLFLAYTTSNILINVFEKETDGNLKNKVEKLNNKGIQINIDDDKKESATSLIFFYCLMILFFKLSRTEIVQLFTIAFGIPIITELLIYNNLSIGDKFVNLIVALLMFFIAYTTETKRKKKFLGQLEFYGKRHTESRRMKKELDYAREIQLSMLPADEMKFGDLEIAATSVPTYEVGGDYFDYFKITDKLIGVFICDVSGHGVASALLLSGLRSCMHLILEDTNNPKEVFTKLNRMIRKTQNRKMFVTAVFAVIDLEKNICSLFNAGHLPPYKISGDSNELLKIRRHGITLGAVEDIAQDMGETEINFEFKLKDKLILYTDGVSEAMNINKSEYGFDRLENFLNTNADKNPSELLKKLVEDVNNFTKDTEQKDDMSIMIIGRN